MIDNERALISLHEGRKAKKYKDSLGFWTIGVGHLIDLEHGGSLPTFIAIALAHKGLDVYKGDAMPEDLIDMLLDYDIKVHAQLIEKFQPWVKALDPVRHAVMVDMCFNLGPEPFDHDGFKDWPNFCEQMRTGQWEKAASNMLGTTWAKQVGKRAKRLAGMVRSGQWPKE